MHWNRLNILEVLKAQNALGFLLAGQHGLERETLRVNVDGTLATTPHPKSMSDPFTDAEITTDFSESQLEFITAPYDTVEAAVEALTKIHQRALQGLENNELLWPSSMPCILPDHEAIPVAHYGDDPKAQEKEIYRNGLAHRYGKYVQMLCGVHYNMSFSEDLWRVLYDHFGDGESLQEFKNERTLGLVRNFIRRRWLLVYLLGATPFRHESYRCGKMTQFDMNTSVALRSSRCGYHNPEEVKIRYNNFPAHLQSIENAMSTPHEPYKKFGGPPNQLNDHLLQIANEYYFPIRMKPTPHDEGFLEGLKETGVAYIELRLLDVNPHTPTGVDEPSLRLSHLFMMYCWLSESPGLLEEQRLADQHQEFAAVHGRTPLPNSYQEEGLSMLTAMQDLAAHLGPQYESALGHYTKEFQQPENLHWRKVVMEMQASNQNFIDYHLDKAQQHKNTLQDV